MAFLLTHMLLAPSTLLVMIVKALIRSLYSVKTRHEAISWNGLPYTCCCRALARESRRPTRLLCQIMVALVQTINDCEKVVHLPEISAVISLCRLFGVLALQSSMNLKVSSQQRFAGAPYAV